VTINVGILTVSDRASSGEYQDKSGPLISQIIASRTKWRISQQSTVRDNKDEISTKLIQWSENNINLILTTGGTGFAERDITPEATLQVIQRSAPGIAEAMRYESLKITKHAMLSRAVAGMRGSTLIINLPGSPRAVKENLDVILPILPHALELLEGSSGAEKGHRSV
jgi:molybdenum cofactor synthesis domain-containing protein